jgi:hypothetical protein
MQSLSETTTKETKQLLDFTKRQQLMHTESFSEMKAKIEEAMKMHDEYIKVSQTNISLTAELQDYKKQTRILVEEMRQKDEEIGSLRQSLAEGSSDVRRGKGGLRCKEGRGERGSDVRMGEGGAQM